MNEAIDLTLATALEARVTRTKTQTTAIDNLPAGFKDISKPVRSAMVGHYTQYTDQNGYEHTVNFYQAQAKAVSYILQRVVKHNGAFLNCFAKTSLFWTTILRLQLTSAQCIPTR